MVKRKSTEQGFGWAEFIDPVRQVTARGIRKVDQLLVPTMVVYYLLHMRTLAEIGPLAE